MSPVTPSAILLIHCQDRQGLVSAITSWVFSHHVNILEIDQHVDNENGAFFMRVEWDLHGFDLPEEAIEQSFDSKGTGPGESCTLTGHLAPPSIQNVDLQKPDA